MSNRVFGFVAFGLGLIYVFVTPPFMVPDESGHMWRSFAFAQGILTPARTAVPISIAVEDRMGVLFWHVEEAIYRGTGKYGWNELRVAWQLVPDGKRQNVKVAWIYTPAPYIAQTVAVWTGTRLNLRPLVIFYFGRIANLVASLLVITLAMAIAPQCRMIFGLVTLLPMTMYELASWSGDAATIAYAFLFIAIVLRASTADRVVTRMDIVSISFLALMLALCKPAYFLLAALTLGIPANNFRSPRQRFLTLTVVTVLVASATATSMAYFNRGFFNMRSSLPIDPKQQLECIRRDPLRFAGVVASEVATNGRFYIEGGIGRFGMYDIKLPIVAIYAGAVLTLFVALTSQVMMNRQWRVIALTIFVATSCGVIVSQYLIWSVVCGDSIEGVQGRYFLPVLPLLAMAISGVVRRHSTAFVMYGVITACNLLGVATLVTEYWL